MIALKRILVPYDFSETSAAAVTHAVALARTFGAELAFLYVPDPSLIERDVLVDADGTVDKVENDRLLTMLAPADRFALKPQFYVRTGKPAEEIVRFASEHLTDLIVMGTHGRGLIGHMVMGSVAEKVVRTAPCPVLTVRNAAGAQHSKVFVAAAETALAAV